jgi:hypothetical protein
MARNGGWEPRSNQDHRLILPQPIKPAACWRHTFKPSSG